MKSAVVIRSTEVASALSVNLKHLPISFLLILLTAQISLNVRGTPSWRQAMYKHADALASFDRPFRFLPSCTCLKRLLARSTIVLGKFIRSAIVEISLNAAIKARSELLIVRRFWYFAAEMRERCYCVRLGGEMLRDSLPKASNEAGPVPGPIIVDRSPPLSNGFSGPPTRDGSTPDFSLLNVRHSDPTSMTRSPTTKPHSEQIMSPAL